MKSPAVPCCCKSGPTAAETIDLRAPEQVRAEADLLRVVEIGRGDSAYTETFLALLDERHAIYQGVGTPVVTRIRGALLLALGHRALPTAALPFVLEELETAHDAWLTAVAAHVLRKYPEPLPSFAQPLLSAILYIRHRDDVVRLANYAGHGPGGETTTAMAEVMRTIAWLGRSGMACLSSLEDLLAQNPGPATSAMVANAIKAIREDDQTSPAECCGCGEAPRAILRVAPKDISGLRLQDHSGTELSFAEAFHGRPSIVVFFYTRCDNPAKCPLTMYKFGSLQRLLQESELGDSIGTAAITYDPEYDSPERLLRYAQSWGAKPSSLHRVLRTVGDFSTLRDYFELGVNFGASGIVNRHQLEAFVLDQNGHIAHVVARRRWDEAQLVRLAAALVVDRALTPSRQ
jgi:cytochrome oxidase Cu insertion factor (SCO1/SenC/PrrC family)